MANESTTGAPLTATVGERLGEKAQEGDTAGLDRAQAVVEDLRSSGWEARGPEAQPAERQASERRRPEAQRAAGRTPPRQQRSRAARGSGVAWALAAGLGTLAVIGIVRRAFGR